MIRDLSRRLEGRLRSRFGWPQRWTNVRLLGHDLVVRDGSVLPEPDYDDAWLCACAREAKVMFDVGANVGQSALLALMSGSIEQLVLLEANWQALSVAAQNVIRNGLSARVRFIEGFVSDRESETVRFWTVGTGAAGSMYEGHAVTAAKAGDVREIATTTLDRVMATTGLVPDLVKIDVEGAEAKVLAGARELASRMKSRFLIEMHSPPELPMRENAELVLEWARRLGYQAWYLAEATRLDAADMIAHRGRCHLLVQPDAWPFPAFLNGIRQSAPLPQH